MHPWERCQGSDIRRHKLSACSSAGPAITSPHVSKLRCNNRLQLHLLRIASRKLFFSKNCSFSALLLLFMFAEEFLAVGVGNRQSSQTNKKEENTAKFSTPFVFHSLLLDSGRSPDGSEKLLSPTLMLFGSTFYYTWSNLCQVLILFTGTFVNISKKY